MDGLTFVFSPTSPGIDSHVQAVFTPEEMASDGTREDGLAVIQGILEAHAFAVEDPYRATTTTKA